MKTLVTVLVVVLILIGGFFILNQHIYNEKQGDGPYATMETESPFTIIPISHATAVIPWGDAVLYTDPVGSIEAFAGQPSPTIILITDIHQDHFDPATLSGVAGRATIIVPQAVKDKLPAELVAVVKVLKNDEILQEQGFTIETVPMYNLPESETAFHTKGRGNGYVIEKEGVRLYVAGDTSGIPEMRVLQNIDTALIPMNLPYTMDVEEAADATLSFKPRHVYPYHYRGQNGLADVNHFKELVNAGDPAIDVVLLNWYP